MKKSRGFCMILSAIAAMAKNGIIGINNKLPWHIPEDLKYFREKTKGKIVILGRKTFESLNGEPLPGRFHIVISRNSKFQFNHKMVKIVPDFQSALSEAEKLIPIYSEEVFVIGGSEIYKMALPLIHKLYLTVIEKNYEGDACFPSYNEKDFVLLEKNQLETDPKITFLTYKNINL